MKIVLLLSSFCLLILAFIPSQKITINGTVLNEQKQPVQGASIIIKGTKTGTVSDSAGHFSLTVQSNNTVLLISYVGYKTATYKVKKDDAPIIALKASSEALDEVVVIGYGTAKNEDYDKEYSPMPARRELTGSVASINAKTLSGDKYSSYNNQYKPIYNSQPDSAYNREGYDNIEENPFLKVTDNPLSTFSIDVDAASYSNIRRFLNDGELPPAGAVRIEEMINYFSYHYPQPTGDAPFSINTEIETCPWNANHKLMMIGLQGKIISAENLPSSNLVFLIDVSGSMMEEDKLPLVQASLKLLTDQLRAQDKVSLVVYAGNAGLVLPPTNGGKKQPLKMPSASWKRVVPRQVAKAFSLLIRWRSRTLSPVEITGLFYAPMVILMWVSAAMMP